MAHVALLRGINLGPRNRVPMAELRAALEGLGHHDVRTVLASGNAVFAGGRPSAARIEAAVLERTGVAAPVVVVPGARFRAIAAANPFTGGDPSRVLVGFLLGPLGELPEEDWSPERFAAGDGAVYLDLPEGVQRSRLTAAVGRAAGGRITMRNRATVEKLVALL